MAELTGGCACGAVRYEARAGPTFSFHCQCRRCQRASGAGHASAFTVPADALTISGTLTFHEEQADSGNTVSRGFCPTCGCPLMNINTGYPDVRYMTAASLDDPGVFKPETIVWASAAQPWDHLDPSLSTV